MLDKAARIRRTIRHLQRFRDIVRVFLKYGYEDLAHRLHLPSALGLPLVGHALVPQGLSAGERLRRACEELGPTFVKLGQLLSTRPELLPPGVAEELARLQDSASPLPFEELKKVIETELRGDAETFFSEIDEAPLGAASIAQAHRGKLKTGETVVVKVQRPGIRKIVTVDIDILRQVAALMEEHLPGAKAHRPTHIVEELVRKLEGELDFTREAANAERFAAQFAGDETIFVPEVYRETSTSRVLTLEYVDGLRASEAFAGGTADLDREALAKRISALMMRQIFAHGFFHADPHPGNILILPGKRHAGANGAKPRPAVVCFLDYGQMGYLDTHEREDFADLLWGVARRDAPHVARALSRLGGDGAPRAGLEADAAEFMHRHFYRPLKELEFGRLVTHMLDIASRHDLALPSDFFVMLKALSVTEGLVRSLDPEVDVMSEAAPVVRRVRLARLRPQRVAHELADAGMQFGSLARDLPSEIRRLLHQIRSGEIKIFFRHDNLDPLIHSWDQVSNRIAFSVVLAALIIGSSLMVHADIPPRIFGIPAIGLSGFLLAGLMGFWLLIAIVRHGRM